MNKTLEQAIKFLSMGVSVIPIGYKSKQPDGFRLSLTGDVVEKKSRKGGTYLASSWQGYQKNLPEYWKINKWFKSGRAGIGIITGWKNLVVIDFDNIAAYKVWKIFEKKNNLPPTYKVNTRRGVHVYFFLNTPMDRTIKSPLGIDVKFTGYVLAPPSIHPSGFKYNLLSADNIKTVESLESVLPSDLFRLKEFDFSERKSLVEVVGGIKYGPWDDASNSIDVKKTVEIIRFFPHAENTGGDFHMDLCPFHQDSTASFWINTRLNRCGCHTCINGSYSSIDFYARLKNLSTLDAIREMKTISSF